MREIGEKRLRPCIILRVGAGAVPDTAFGVNSGARKRLFPGRGTGGDSIEGAAVVCDGRDQNRQPINRRWQPPTADNRRPLVFA